jgi:hypothetical protein
MIASCAFASLEKAYGTAIRKADLPSEQEVRITYEGGSLVVWKVTFRGSGPVYTEYRISAAKSVFGNSGNLPSDVTPTVTACAQST